VLQHPKHILKEIKKVQKEGGGGKNQNPRGKENQK
jgi:hypothetical protein